MFVILSFKLLVMVCSHLLYLILSSFRLTHCDWLQEEDTPTLIGQLNDEWQCAVRSRNDDFRKC